MGHLLKQTLKTLCEINQWSYAVFWKFGCQNPKLLIWEECYYEHALSCSGFPGLSGHENDSWVSVENGSLHCNDQARDKLHLLVNNMMMDSHVVILGERLVGRVAITGSHQWIFSKNNYRDAHPPEVLKELRQQFSAGMQTIAVIPVVPRGVVQFGSFLTIMENPRFVNYVTSLELDLRLVAGVLPSENYVAKDQPAKIQVSACLENSCLLESSKYVVSSSQGLMIDSQTSLFGEIKSTNVAAYWASGSTLGHRGLPEAKLAPPLMNSEFLNRVAKAEGVPSNLKMLMNRIASLYNPTVSMRMDPGLFYCSNDGLASHAAVEDQRLCSEQPTLMELKNVNFKKQDVSKSDSINIFADDLLAEYNNALVQPGSGHHLFDVSGPDYENKQFSSCNESTQKKNSCKSRAWSEIFSTSQANSESEAFSTFETDNLLEAVVSQVHGSAKPTMDESISCKTTSMSTSSSAPNVSLPGEANSKLFGVLKHTTKEGATSSSRYFQGSNFSGSQISSGVENEKQNKSISTGYSKKPHEMSNPGRKRLKSGENPRPRPKDRQMIQDSVKELREIVPNGAKCSIDSLFKCTMKHLLFLQSVVKQADKLQQTRESEVVSKDGEATWTYAVGAQSLCPIKVEDLNQPRQMLVEMLCEERGLFLEIANVIRRLGLTILKGIMETRDKKIWSHFTVEANQDITRREVVNSLVHLSEQSANPRVVQPDDNL